MKDNFLRLLYLLKTRGAIRGIHTAIIIEDGHPVLYKHYFNGTWGSTSAYTTIVGQELLSTLIAFNINEAKPWFQHLTNPIKGANERIEAINMTLTPEEELVFAALEGDGMAIDAIKDILKI